jgi:polyisoprenoid-binding protein YceI
MSTPAVSQSTGTTWNIDPAHSVAEFKVRHMMITNVKGQFSGIKGSLTLDDADITKSRVEATIDAASLNTREPQRDAHLKSADFLEVEKFPALSFTSSSVSRVGADQLDVTGDLTIHGVTRAVVFSVEGPSAPAKDPWGNVRVGLSATTKIHRKDFGLNWNAALEAGGFLVGEEVAITLELELVKA